MYTSIEMCYLKHLSLQVTLNFYFLTAGGWDCSMATFPVCIKGLLVTSVLNTGL